MPSKIKSKSRTKAKFKPIKRAVAKRKPAAKSVTHKVKPIPDGMHTVTPHLVCAGASDAIAFYVKAFDAIEVARMEGSPGKLIHAAVKIGDSTIMLVDEFPQMGGFGPKALKGTPVTLHLYVENVDGFVKRAIDAGATAVMPVTDMFWGDRYGQLEDPFGHRWSVATHIKDMSPEEMKTSMSQAMAQHAAPQ
jgi:PhnB protein